MARVALAITLAITLAVTLVSLAEAKSPMFRSEAAEHMDAGFKVVKRRGTFAKDFTRIEVSARPLLMVCVYGQVGQGGLRRDDRREMIREALLWAIRSGEDFVMIGDWN